MFRSLALGFFLTLFPLRSVCAEEIQESTPVTADEAPTPISPKKKKKRSYVPAQKDADGTEALDRFEAETVIKSKYRHNGESLEVDPD